MRFTLKVTMSVDTEKWAENTNGPWPEDDKRSLNTAVRHDIMSYVQTQLDGAAIFEDLGIEVEVK